MPMFAQCIWGPVSIPRAPLCPGSPVGMGVGGAAWRRETTWVLESEALSGVLCLTCSPGLRAQHDHGEGDTGVGRALCRVAPTSRTPGWHVLLVARQVGGPHTKGHRRGRPTEAHPPHPSWLAGTRMFSEHMGAARSAYLAAVCWLSPSSCFPRLSPLPRQPQPVGGRAQSPGACTQSPEA